MTDDDPDIEIVTPQFERTDGIEPAECPETADEIEALADEDPETLKEMGLRPWDGELYLLPVEWYEDIPDGTRLLAIDGEEVVFGRDNTSGDCRRGVLAYGVEVDDG